MISSSNELLANIKRRLGVLDEALLRLAYERENFLGGRNSTNEIIDVTDFHDNDIAEDDFEGKVSPRICNPIDYRTVIYAFG